MSFSMPKEAQSLIDPVSTIRSLKNLTLAVERGEIDLDALVSFAKHAGSGDAPKFAVTSAIPLDMIKAIRANPDRPARQIVYQGVAAGIWSMEDAEKFEANAELLASRGKKAKATRGVYLTKSRRQETYRPSTDNRFTPKINLDAMLRLGLSDGAAKCLALIMSIAGNAAEITTYTSSLATTLGRTTRTVRNYFIQLEEAGLINRRPGRQYNTVHLTIHPDCRPEPYVEPRDMKAFRLARKSSHPALQFMAMNVVAASMEVHQESFATLDRRKQIAVFNQESNSLMHRLCGTLASQSAKTHQTNSIGHITAPTTHSTLLIDPRKPIGTQRQHQFQSSRSASVSNVGEKCFNSSLHTLAKGKF